VREDRFEPGGVGLVELRAPYRGELASEHRAEALYPLSESLFAPLFAA
jgi:hypothetical protein